MGLTIDEVLQRGVEAHKSGRAIDACNFYEQVLLCEPAHADANHNMGVLLLDSGKYNDSLTFFSSALEADASVGQYWLSYIDALIKLGMVDDGMIVLKQAKAIGADGPAFAQLEATLIKLKLADMVSGVSTDASMPSAVNILDSLKLDQALRLAHKKLKDGLLEELRSICEDILVKFPHNKKAKELLRSGSPKTLRKASQQSEPPEELAQEVLQLHRQGKLKEALEQVTQLLEEFPKSASLYNIQGVVNAALGHLDPALECYTKALDIDPNYAAALNNAGNAFKEKGNIAAAVVRFNQAIKVHPKYSNAYNNLGAILKDQGDLNAAVENYKKAIKFNPLHFEAYNNLGTVFDEWADFEAAIDSYGRAIAIEPNNPEVHYNKSLAHLSCENFELGWRYFAWRWQSTINMAKIGRPLETSRPTWQSKREQRVLLWAEQGIGDEVMFSSLIHDIYKCSSKLTVQTDERLTPLFKRSFPNDINFVSSKVAVSEDDYDAHISMGSLPQHFRQTVDSFSSTSPGYLVADTLKAAKIRSNIIGDSSDALIGISWHSTSIRKGVKNRIISLEKMATALASPNVKLVCLQYGDVANQISDLHASTGIEVIQVPEIDNKEDIDGLAALISACDRVVTVDNITVHLSGALGKETQLLLPYSCDWRWGRKRTVSYWYDSVRLHRQTKIGDWDSVVRLL